MLDLTDRERQIVCLIAKGYSTGDIGQVIHLSPGVVQENISRLMEKVGAENRIAVVIKSLKLGEVKLEEIDL